jgi:hypothetical protein
VARVSRATSQAEPTAGRGWRPDTATVLVEVTVSSEKGPSTANEATGLPKKSARSDQLVGAGSTTISLDRQCWRSESRGRRWASFRARETGAAYRYRVRWTIR